MNAFVATFLLLVPFGPAAPQPHTPTATIPLELDPSLSPTAAASRSNLPFVTHQGRCGSLVLFRDCIESHPTHADCFEACSAKWGTALHSTSWWKDDGRFCCCQDRCDYWEPCNSGWETAVVPGRTVPEYEGCDPCVVCPEGTAAGDDFVIPDTGGVTCGDVVNEAEDEDRDSLRCADHKRHELVCCPDQRAESPRPSSSPTAAALRATLPLDRYQGWCQSAESEFDLIGHYETHAACFRACSESEYWGTRLHATRWSKEEGDCWCHDSCEYFNACYPGYETAVVPGKAVPEYAGCDQCLVCPEGVTAEDDFVIPDWGETCGKVADTAKNFGKESWRCAGYKRNEFFCCPDQQAEIPCPFCSGGITADDDFLLSPIFSAWGGYSCFEVKEEAAITREFSERCSLEIKPAESFCCPVRATDSPVKTPSAAPTTTIARSIERSCTQILEIETGKFGPTEANTYEAIMENYTERFGHMVGEPQIVTTCNVTGQEAVGRPRDAAGGHRGRGLQIDLPVSYPMAINFTIRYGSRYGYDVDDYPQQFQSYINNNLQQVADEVSWIIEAKDVTIFNAAGLMGTQTGPSLATPQSRENHALIGLVIALPAGAIITALLIYYMRRRTNLRREAREGSAQEEDGDVLGWPAAVAFDFVFSNKTESDALCLEVINKLTSHNLTVWQQRTNIPKDTDNWFNEWFPSAVRARKIVCFITVEYLKSPYCMREFGIALNSNRLLVVACEPLNKINEVDPSDYPYASNALAYLINGGQVIFHDSDDVIAEILKFSDSTNDEETGARPDLRFVDKTHLMNGGQVVFHVSKDMVVKNLGGSNVTEEFDFVFSNKTESDTLCLGVRDKLMSHGVTVWQQRTNIPKDSDNWFDEWFQSARKARKIVCFLTADYVKSPFCMKEFGIALNTNKLLAVVCDPLAKINEVDPSAYPKASNALAYLINGGDVIIHDSEDVVAEILKFATNPGEASNPNEAEAKAQPKPRSVNVVAHGRDNISETFDGG